MKKLVAVKTSRQKPLLVVPALPDFFFPGLTNAFVSMEVYAGNEVMVKT